MLVCPIFRSCHLATFSSFDISACNCLRMSCIETQNKAALARISRARCQHIEALSQTTVCQPSPAQPWFYDSVCIQNFNFANIIVTTSKTYQKRVNRGREWGEMVHLIFSSESRLNVLGCKPAACQCIDLSSFVIEADFLKQKHNESEICEFRQWSILPHSDSFWPTHWPININMHQICEAHCIWLLGIWFRGFCKKNS